MVETELVAIPEHFKVIKQEENSSTQLLANNGSLQQNKLQTDGNEKFSFNHLKDTKEDSFHPNQSADKTTDSREKSISAEILAKESTKENNQLRQNGAIKSSEIGGKEFCPVDKLILDKCDVMNVSGESNNGGILDNRDQETVF